MTLITRFATAFTDTTLPRLALDPAAPLAGGRVLIDFKSPSCHSQAVTSFGSGQQFQTLLGSNPSQLFAASTTAGTYNPATGAIIGTVNLNPTAANAFVIDNVAQNYCLSFWFRLPSNTGNNLSLAQSHTGGSRSFQLRSVNFGLGLAAINFSHWNAAAPAITASYPYTGGSVFRLGYAWQWSGSIWQYKTISNNNAPSAWINITGLTNPAIGLFNVAQSNAFALEFGSISGGATFRALVENLSVSARSPEQVWAADWARGNGRYS